MKMLILISHIGVWLTLFGSIFLSIGFIGQSEAAPTIKIEREDLQLERKVNLLFALKQLTGEVVIVASTRPTPQITGIAEKDTSQGAVPELKLSGDEDWEQKWVSKPIRVKEEGTRLPDKFALKFKFSEPQPLKFDVKYTHDDEYIGTYVTYLSDIASAGHSVEPLRVLDENSGTLEDSEGIIVVEFEEDLKDYDDEVAYEFVGENFPDETSMLPYIILSRQMDDGEWKQIDTTFTKDFDNAENPEFRPLSVRVSRITEAKNNELQLKFACYLRNYDRPEVEHKYLGEFHSTFQELDEDTVHNCNPPGVNNDDTNIVRLKKKTHVPTFLDVAPGLDIQVFVSVDFTSSNKQGEFSNTRMGLHTVGTKVDDELNHYEQALSSIVPVVEHYDNDKLIPLAGFGGKINGGRKSSDFFYLKPLLKSQKAKNDKTEHCDGSIDLLRTYHNVMLEGSITLASPTYYKPTFEHIAAKACAKRGHSDSYFMLVVLTDGAYTDRKETKLEIAKASDCPLSIVLVGIGDQDFKLLEELDNDNGLPFREKDESGVVHEAKADIVQLVVFRELYDKYNLDEAMIQLKDKVLEEFSTHIHNYFKMHNLTATHKPLEELKTVKPTARNQQDMIDLLMFGKVKI